MADTQEVIIKYDKEVLEVFADYAKRLREIEKQLEMAIKNNNALVERLEKHGKEIKLLKDAQGGEPIIYRNWGR